MTSTLPKITLLHIVVCPRLSTSLEKETHQSLTNDFFVNDNFGHFMIFLLISGLVLKVFVFIFLLAYKIILFHLKIFACLEADLVTFA